jgi:hypothetical protein
MVTIISAKMALARFTNDSIASDSKPTESVMYQASVLSVMVTMATSHRGPQQCREGDQLQWREGSGVMVR